MSAATDALTDDELRHIAEGIEEAGPQGLGDPTKSAVLQALYLDRLHEKRQKALEQIFEEAVFHFGDPNVQRQYPSLCDASEGDPNVMAKYVVWFMLSLGADGIDRDIEHCANECESAFAMLVYGDARLHR